MPGTYRWIRGPFQAAITAEDADGGMVIAACALGTAAWTAGTPTSVGRTVGNGARRGLRVAVPVPDSLPDESGVPAATHPAARTGQPGCAADPDTPATPRRNQLRAVLRCALVCPDSRH